MLIRTFSMIALCCLFTVLFASMNGCATSSDARHAGGAAPDAFEHAIRGGSVKAASGKAAADDRLLLVFGTADWCGPCQRMKADAWTDPSVIAWTGEHAMMYYLDVDEHESIRAELDINAFPTLIAFRGEEELDRIVGYRDAGALHDWLTQLNSR